MRAHGLPLQTTCAVRERPPNLGTFQPERHHPWFGRTNLAILLGKKCNHDVNILMRVPPAKNDEKESAASMLNMILASMKTLTQYITAYTSKTQPHAESLWRALQLNIARLDAELAAKDVAEERNDVDPVYRTQRLLMRMSTTVHKRCHRSLQEAVNFLLHCPESYSSHSFRPLYITNALHCATAALEQPVIVGELPAEAQQTYILTMPRDALSDRAHMETFAAPSRPRLTSASQHTDYEHRGAQLQAWCWYFYVASITRVAADKAAFDETVFIFAASHPNPSGWAQKLSCASAWKIPALVGPSFPSKGTDAERYAAMMLLLFRPWIGDVKSILRLSDAEPDSMCTTWSEALGRYLTHLHSKAAELPSSESPTVFSDVFWARRILQVVVNISNWCTPVSASASDGVRVNPDAAEGCLESTEVHADRLAEFLSHDSEVALLEMLVKVPKLFAWYTIVIV